MRKTLFTLLAVASICLMANAAAPRTLIIAKVATAPAIDGDASDWGTTWNQMDSSFGTTTTASCRFQCEYDDNFLYFVFDAKDADMYDTTYTATWNSDCIEIALSMSTDSLESSSGMYVFRRMAGDASHNNGLTDGITFGNDIPISRWLTTTDLKINEIDAGDGYVMEWQIPWDSMIVAIPDPDAGIGAFDRKHFKLEVLQSDRTLAAGTRTQMNFWFGMTNDAWHNSAYQGLITLADSLQLPKPPLTIYRTATPPTIDGDTADWGTDWVDMTKAPITNTTTGMTAKFQSKFDYNNLYMIFSVTDDTPGDTSVAIGTWLRDNVMVMLSMDTTSSKGMTGMYFLKRVYGWDAGTGAPGGDSGLTDGTTYGNGVSSIDWNASPNFKIKEAIDGNTYIQEWQIPWDSLKVRMAPAWDTKQFKLEVEAADNTGITRTQQLFWYSNTDSAWNNSAYMGVVTLDYNIPIPPKRQLTIRKTATPPTIDGDASDWGTSWIKMDSTALAITTSAACKFQAEYDDNNLYLIFDAKDADMFDTIYSAPWNSDCIELALSMSTDSLESSSGMYVFRKMVGDASHSNGLTDGITFGKDIPISRWLTNTDLKINETDAGDGYVMEWQIPWDSLIVALPDIPNSIPAFDNKHFKLEVLQSDRTVAAGTRTQMNFWFGKSNDGWHNSAYQGLVTLYETLVIDTTPPDGINNKVSAKILNIYVVNDHLVLSRPVPEISVYNIAGQLLLNAKNASSISISGLKQGLYIARTENVSYKFIRQ